MTESRKSQLTDEWAADLTASDRELLGRARIATDAACETLDTPHARLLRSERHNALLRAALAAATFMLGVCLVAAFVVVFGWSGQ